MRQSMEIRWKDDMSRQWLHRLFDAVDAKDTPRFLEFLAEDASFRFGNLPACRGKREIGIAVQAFLIRSVLAATS